MRIYPEPAPHGVTRTAGPLARAGRLASVDRPGGAGPAYSMVGRAQTGGTRNPAGARWSVGGGGGPAGGQFGGEGGPGDRVVAGDDAVAAGGGQGLELADGDHGDLGLDVDEAADGQFFLDVDGEIGGVEGEDQAATTDRLVEVDDEALVAGGVADGEDRGDAGGDLGVAVGLAPVQAGVVVVDAEDAVLFRAGGVVQAVSELAPLDVDGDAAREQLEAAGVVEVEMTDGHGVDVGEVDAGRGQGFLQRFARAGQDRLHERVAVE